MSAYSNPAKQQLLGVSATTLEQHGAVSEAVAIQMAEGALAKAQADIAVSVTGIAGPGGGSEDKPVGTVWIGIATATSSKAIKKFTPYGREIFKQATSQDALNLVRQTLGGKPQRGLLALRIFPEIDHIVDKPYEHSSAHQIAENDRYHISSKSGPADHIHVRHRVTC